MAARYHLRLFLDAGAGVCLWSQDDATRERFNYPVELRDLSLPDDMERELERLMADYDAKIDWTDPGRTADPDPGLTSFGHEADAPFRERIMEILPRLRAALGPDFRVESDFEA